MALTNNLLAGLLTYGTDKTRVHPITTNPVTPQPSNEDDEAPTPFTVTQDGTLGFPLATNYEEDITDVPTNTVTAVPEQATVGPQATKHGDLLQLMQRLTTADSLHQHVNEFRWQHTTHTDANKFKDEAFAPSSRP